MSKMLMYLLGSQKVVENVRMSGFVMLFFGQREKQVKFEATGDARGLRLGMQDERI